MAKKIVIVDDEPVTKMDIKELLEEAGYDVVGQASNGFEAINECKTHKPDLVIMDIKMPMLDGLKASKKIMHDHIAGGILLLTAFYDKEFVEQAKEVGALGYLVKPLDEKSFIPTVEMCISRAKDIQSLNQQVEEVSKKLEDRKFIDKAKGLLMKEKNLDEQDAYKLLRKMSMDGRTTIGEIARTIVIVYE
ncbi:MULTISPECIES: ANTAR domain-containing response regulator [Oceanobacillus]|uniref:Fis family transcriptional regulator n=1 Tax=Oceanobacillus indicireducens TaxID=1004261 RepID=A0A917XXC5_9BACI|nr:response regulator [Oceanobacillus indicireducens]GGN57242.1 Fis family transcriptional regulator [Oceanobacillus indicireducens]